MSELTRVQKPAAPDHIPQPQPSLPPEQLAQIQGAAKKLREQAAKEVSAALQLAKTSDDERRRALAQARRASLAEARRDRALERIQNAIAEASKAIDPLLERLWQHTTTCADTITELQRVISPTLNDSTPTPTDLAIQAADWMSRNHACDLCQWTSARLGAALRAAAELKSKAAQNELTKEG
jgi:hypothetical protein